MVFKAFKACDRFPVDHSLAGSATATEIIKKRP